MKRGIVYDFKVMLFWDTAADPHTIYLLGSYTAFLHTHSCGYESPLEEFEIDLIAPETNPRDTRKSTLHA